MTEHAEAIRLAEGLTWRVVDGEVVVLNASATHYIAVNGTGRVLWEALDRGSTRDGLVAKLVDRFDVTDDVATRDVEAWLAGLAERGLLA